MLNRLSAFIRGMRIVILMTSIAMMLYVCHRFGIVKDSYGSYLLIDWHFSWGRSLSIGDRVFYQFPENAQIRIGRIVFLPDKNMEKIYWVSPEEGKLEATKTIKARVLMVLFQTDMQNLPYK